MSDELTFVDANVLVYAYDLDAGAKHQMSQKRSRSQPLALSSYSG
jgi:predicted nucleic acid-binding protein